MSIDIIQNILMRCSIINIGLLLWWVLIIVFAHDWVYKIHSKYFKLSIEKFDTIHYTGIAFFKTLIFFFNIVPYIALHNC